MNCGTRSQHTYMILSRVNLFWLSEIQSFVTLMSNRIGEFPHNIVQKNIINKNQRQKL